MKIFISNLHSISSLLAITCGSAGGARYMLLLSELGLCHFLTTPELFIRRLPCPRFRFFIISFTLPSLAANLDLGDTILGSKAVVFLLHILIAAEESWTFLGCREGAGDLMFLILKLIFFSLCVLCFI
ncbi:unnamed protein product [Moneuplotes crassus]|uniref:Uncharacterized protein n=1 Tax=Euplotes crassus TaxID=5936 RepID=A0AAD1XBW5_EUPCR|nr:unnamed protein product [Moneuplotes crassus]